MGKKIFLLGLFLFSGCGKPLIPYNFNDALLIKKSIMHRQLGNLSQKVMDEISIRRLLFQNKTINVHEFERQKKEIQEYQQSEIKKIQNDFNQYKKTNPNQQ